MAVHAPTPRTRNRRHLASMPCPSSERLRPPRIDPAAPRSRADMRYLALSAGWKASSDSEKRGWSRAPPPRRRPPRRRDPAGCAPRPSDAGGSGGSSAQRSVPPPQLVVVDDGVHGLPPAVARDRARRRCAGAAPGGCSRPGRKSLPWAAPRTGRAVRVSADDPVPGGAAVRHQEVHPRRADTMVATGRGGPRGRSIPARESAVRRRSPPHRRRGGHRRLAAGLAGAGPGGAVPSITGTDADVGTRPAPRPPTAHRPVAGARITWELEGPGAGAAPGPGGPGARRATAAPPSP